MGHTQHPAVVGRLSCSESNMTMDAEHFKQPDDGKCAWAVRKTVYRSWRSHKYVLESHASCGFHMKRIGPCHGECYAGNSACEEFTCISERAIGRTYFEEP